MDDFELPIENWQHVFNFLDANSYAAVSQTCRDWSVLVNQPSVWSCIYNNFHSGLSEEVYPYLPSDDELRLYKVSENGDEVQNLKRKLRVLATSLLVLPEREEDNDREEDWDDNGDKEQQAEHVQGIITKATNHCTILRKKRVFISVSQALEAAREGDYIYLLRGDFREPLTISKPVHLFGNMYRSQNENGKTTNILSCYLFKPVVIDLQDYQTDKESNCSLSSVIIQSDNQITIKNASVVMNRVLFSENCNVTVGQNCYAQFWQCGWHDDQGINDAITVHQDFTGISMQHCTIAEIFPLEALSRVFHKFEQLLHAYKQSQVKPSSHILSGCLRVFENASGQLANFEVIEFIRNSNLLEKLYNIFPNFEDDIEVAMSMVGLVQSLSLTEKMNTSFRKFNFVLHLKRLLRKTITKPTAQIVILSTMWTLISLPEPRKFFRQDGDVFSAIMETLDKNGEDERIVNCVFSTLWHAAHHIPASGAHLINFIDVIIRTMDKHKEKEDIQVEACGFLWNLPPDWPAHVTPLALPRTINALKTVTSTDNVHTVLGLIVKLLKTTPTQESHVAAWMVEHDAISLLLNVKNKFEGDEVNSRIFTIFTWMANTKSAQKVLAERISQKGVYSPISKLDRIKIARCLAIQDEVSDKVLNTVENILRKSDKSELYFYALDTLVRIALNDNVQKNEKQMNVLTKILFEKGSNFIHFDKVLRWLDWAHLVLEKLPYDTTEYGVDIKKTVGFIVSKDKRTLRHDFNCLFGSAIGERAVLRGKWYYEVELYDGGFFQIGWVREDFEPHPDRGEGVGDDNLSWAIDLSRHVKWHKTEDTPHLPFAPEITWQAGGIVQCFLDMDLKTMSFGYDGRFIGEAFSDFSVGSGGLLPALSTHLENECKFNFGNENFRFPPERDSGYLPLKLAPAFSSSS